MTSECPDCTATLAPGATRCRCGWVLPPAHLVTETKHVVPCDTVGCGKPGRRIGARLVCTDCEANERHRAAEAFCKSQGLVTIEDKREFCRRTARDGMFSRFPSFQRWASGIKQAAVDLMVLHDGKGDREALERLRAEGAIDGRNQVIPPEARAVAKEAYRAERARQIAQVQEQLDEARRRSIAGQTPDTEVVT